MTILRSNRPYRSNALSMLSSKLVAARTTIGSLLVLSPSNYASSWLIVRFSSLLTELPRVPAREPTASISSMKIIAGAMPRAYANNSRTRLGPLPPTNSIKSAPLQLRKGTLASPATAFASSVFPVPGYPVSKQPRGRRAPNRVNSLGLTRKSTYCRTSSLAYGIPMTSLNVVPLTSTRNWRFLMGIICYIISVNGLPEALLAPHSDAPDAVRRKYT